MHLWHRERLEEESSLKSGAGTGKHCLLFVDVSAMQIETCLLLENLQHGGYLIISDKMESSSTFGDEYLQFRLNLTCEPFPPSIVLISHKFIRKCVLSVHFLLLCYEHNDLKPMFKYLAHLNSRLILN